MKSYFLVLVLSFHVVLPCEVSWDCEKCTKTKCVYVATKTTQYCDDPINTETITDADSYTEDYQCAKLKTGTYFKTNK